MHPNYNFAPLNSHEPKDRSNSCFLRAKFCALQIVQSSCLGRAESDAGWAEEMSKTPLLNLNLKILIYFMPLCAKLSGKSHAM